VAEYRLSPAAQSDLQQIFDYTLREWGLEQLNSVYSKLGGTASYGQLECSCLQPLA
jgi:plasmid stabilization system protein ParE